MKFNIQLKPEVKEILENEYKGYVAKNPMTAKEKAAVKEWVKDGHSVYGNSCYAVGEDMLPVDFLTVYRDEEYIRCNTKGMNAEDSRKFALAYYGWD